MGAHFRHIRLPILTICKGGKKCISTRRNPIKNQGFLLGNQVTKKGSLSTREVGFRINRSDIFESQRKKNQQITRKFFFWNTPFLISSTISSDLISSHLVFIYYIHSYESHSFHPSQILEYCIGRDVLSSFTPFSSPSYSFTLVAVCSAFVSASPSALASLHPHATQ